MGGGSGRFGFGVFVNCAAVVDVAEEVSDNFVDEDILSVGAILLVVQM